jgi:hypothetical protein
MRPEDVSKKEYTNWLFEQAKTDLGIRPAEIGMTTPRVTPSVGKGMKGMGEPGEMAFSMPQILIPPPDKAINDMIEALNRLFRRFGEAPGGGPDGWSRTLRLFITRQFGETDLGRKLLKLFRFKPPRYATNGREIYKQVTWSAIIRALHEYQTSLYNAIGRRSLAPVTITMADLTNTQGGWIVRMREIFAEGQSYTDILTAFGLHADRLYGTQKKNLFGYELKIVTALQGLIGEVRRDINFEILNSQLRRIVAGARWRQWGRRLRLGTDETNLSALQRVIAEIQAGFADGENFDVVSLMAKLHELQSIFYSYEMSVRKQLTEYMVRQEIPEDDIERILKRIMPAFFVNGRNPTEVIHINLRYILEFMLRRFERSGSQAP